MPRRRDVPDLVLLDYVLPDMKGDEVSRHLSQKPATAKVRVVYMSGFGADLKPDQVNNANVIGSLNKPFTSDLLLKTVEKYMPKEPSQPESKAVETEEPSKATETAWPEPEPSAPEPSFQAPEPRVVEPTWPAPAEFAASDEPAWKKTNESAPEPAETAETAEAAETAGIAASAGASGDAWWSAPVSPSGAWPEAQPAASTSTSAFESPSVPQFTETPAEAPLPVNGAFFSGDTSFFSLNGALHTIGKEKLTGTLRALWNKESIELLARNGEVVLVTTKDPQLYCPEAPITLVNVDAEKIEQARAQQRETACPVFLTLAREELILNEPALQLVQHYGQKLFAQLWTATRVRFVFDQSEALPDYCRDLPGEADIDHWILTTLRCIQFQELGQTPDLESGSVPAYTRDGFQRVQELRLTVAEAQFASQFNGVRSIAQIAKNLRLDFKFARLTLFRFLALEIVECWPPAAVAKPEKRGFFKAIGFGD